MKRKRKFDYHLLWLVPMILFMILGMIVGGCSTVRYVPVETIKTEYINHTDTVLKTDSIISEKNTIIREADSSLVALLGIQLKNNERAILVLQKELQKQINKQAEYRTDTIYRTDSIQVPYPVEKQLTRWQQWKMDFGGGVLLTFALTVLALVLYIGISRRRKQ